tara:strand:- start:777 stop:1220 length:444 start_codon:yes stop_codon:yes gene_type:complete
MIVPGFPHHIVQRGHNRQRVFVERRDFEYDLANLQEWKLVYELGVFSYCLMTNHIHLDVQANDNLSSNPQLMKRLAGRQTRFVNALEKRTGSLWEGRYRKPGRKPGQIYFSSTSKVGCRVHSLVQHPENNDLSDLSIAPEAKVKMMG